MDVPPDSMVQYSSKDSCSARKIMIFRGFSSDVWRKKATASSLPSPSMSTICRDWILLPPAGAMYS